MAKKMSMKNIFKNKNVKDDIKKRVEALELHGEETFINNVFVTPEYYDNTNEIVYGADNADLYSEEFERYEEKQKIESISETSDNFQVETTRVNLLSEYKTKVIRPQHVCEMCGNKRCDDNDSYIILSCNHIYHIKCLADEHHYDAKKCHVLDDEFFNGRRCNVDSCNTTIETAEILFIHNKFYKSTNEHMLRHETQIQRLEHEMNKLKDDLRLCMEYKQKLEFEREKSKQIIAMLNTMF